LAVLRYKYAATGEFTPADVIRRVARALAQAEAPDGRPHWTERFEQALQAGFIPAGRILAGAGLTPAPAPDQLLRAAPGNHRQRG
jgi:ribonucleoside-diphosphate reductase alpha chain